MIVLSPIQRARRRADRRRDAGDWSEAARIYRHVLRFVPWRAALWVQLGNALKEAGDPAEAEAAYRRALSAAPRRADTHLQLGHLLKQRGRDAEALAAYRDAVRLDPLRAEACTELLHRASQEVRSLIEAGRPQDGLGLMEDLLAVLPPASETLLVHAQALAGVARHDDALAAIRAALAMEGFAPEKGPDPDQPASVLAGELLLAFMRARPHSVGAAAALHAIVRPGLTMARLGDDRRDALDWAAAAQFYRQALSLSPWSGPVWVQLGHVLKEGADFVGAEDAYRRALSVMPGRADTYLQLGHLLKRLARRPEAIAAYREAVRLDPARAEACAELLRLASRDALAMIESGRAREGLACMEDLLASVPPSAETELRRAQALAAAAMAEDALAAIRNALAMADFKPDPDPGADLPAPRRAHELLAAYLRHNPRSEGAAEALRALRWRRRAAARSRGTLGPAAGRLPRSLRFMAVGTTGLCNASCIHCPTGKPETAHSPRHPMPLPMFEKLVRGLAELHVTIAGSVNFGLFGDALADPHIVGRVRLAREWLPDARLVVTTNGAAYNRARHRELAALATYVAVHVESLVPETYDRLMQPLRAARVFPKIDQILEDFSGLVDISVPVSRLNRDELPAMRDHFRDRGAVSVHFDPLSSRCASDQSQFRALAFAPQPHRCGPVVGDDLVIDCDGRVLMCCNDFERLDAIGDLSRESVFEVLTSDARDAMREVMRDGRHAEKQSCSRCFFDRAVGVVA